MFKKVVIADSLAPLVNEIFRDYELLNGGTLWLGAIYFAFQIYCDFSGYSDIAIGTSKLFGFELMSNFKFPYFSRNIGEFWRKWHISLSTWFRDYLYIPLGGSKGGKWKSIRNIFIIFLVSGFWHGSNWTFIFWGLFHSILFLPSFLFNTNRKYTTSTIAEHTPLPSSKECFQVGITFLLVTIGWVFFRSETIEDAFNYLNHMFFDISLPKKYRSEIISVGVFIFSEYLIKKDERLSFKLFKNHLFNYLIYSIILLFIVSNFYEKSQFIYFQF